MSEYRQKLYLLLGIVMFLIVVLMSALERGTLFLIKGIQLHSSPNDKVQQGPNILFILTDDQDSELGSANYMPHVQQLIINEGVTFSNSFVASPLCCPSRATVLTGKYVHNHNTINNSLEGGCSSRGWQNGPERDTFVTLLKSSGYQTFFAGKYLNQYGHRSVGGVNHVPPGWDTWIGLVGNSRYLDYDLSVNGQLESHGSDETQDYLTKVIGLRAAEFLEKADKQSPFFMMLSTPAAHAPFLPESKWKGNFTNLSVPRSVNFNIVNGKEKHWLLRQGIQPLPRTVVEKLDNIYRDRLRTLLSVDVLVADVIADLERRHLLESTYVMFTSDNGYHLGQFSLHLDKRQPYEFDIRVPLYMRGPGIGSGIINSTVSNTDLAPTFLDLAGIKIPEEFDGISLLPILARIEVKMLDDTGSVPSYRDSFEHLVLIEHSGEGEYVNEGCRHLGPNMYGCSPEYSCKCSDSFNSSFSCVRRLDEVENYIYCKFLDDELFEELYNLSVDPYQLNNIIKDTQREKMNDLHSLLAEFSLCYGLKCHKLSESLHVRKKG